MVSLRVFWADCFGLLTRGFSLRLFLGARVEGWWFPKLGYPFGVLIIRDKGIRLLGGLFWGSAIFVNPHGVLGRRPWTLDGCYARGNPRRLRVEV